MLDEQTMRKLEAWVESHPESADTPFMNVSTGEEFTVRGLLDRIQTIQSNENEEEQISESLQSELRQIESWIGGL